MNGPNKTVASFKNRKWSKTAQLAFNTRAEADFYAAPFVANGMRVTVRPFRFGPKDKSCYHYSVTVYQSE